MQGQTHAEMDNIRQRTMDDLRTTPAHHERNRSTQQHRIEREEEDDEPGFFYGTAAPVEAHTVDLENGREPVAGGGEQQERVELDEDAWATAQGIVESSEAITMPELEQRLIDSGLDPVQVDLIIIRIREADGAVAVAQGGAAGIEGQPMPEEGGNQGEEPLVLAVNHYERMLLGVHRPCMATPSRYLHKYVRYGIIMLMFVGLVALLACFLMLHSTFVHNCNRGSQDLLTAILGDDYNLLKEYQYSTSGGSNNTAHLVLALYLVEGEAIDRKLHLYNETEPNWGERFNDANFLVSQDAIVLEEQIKKRRVVLQANVGVHNPAFGPHPVGLVLQYVIGHETVLLNSVDCYAEGNAVSLA